MKGLLNGIGPAGFPLSGLTFQHDDHSMTDLKGTDVTWSEIARRLSEARNYWLATTRPNGSPHVAPVWGAVVTETLYLYSTRETVKAKNLARDPRAVVHLESGDRVCIVHGDIVDRGHPSHQPRILAALAGKYNRAGDQPYLPSNDPSFDVLYELRPRHVMLWDLEDYETSQLRWARG